MLFFVIVVVACNSENNCYCTTKGGVFICMCVCVCENKEVEIMRFCRAWKLFWHFESGSLRNDLFHEEENNKKWANFSFLSFCSIFKKVLKKGKVFFFVHDVIDWWMTFVGLWKHSSQVDWVQTE